MKPSSPFSEQISVNESDLAENDMLIENDDLMPKTTNERREKIEKFLKEDRERKMNHKIPVQSQQLHVMKEDLALKRKVAEQSESADKEYLAHAVKMSKTMETMAGAMQGCLQMMTTMIQMQANQQQIFPFGFQSNMQSHQSGMVSKKPMAPKDIPD